MDLLFANGVRSRLNGAVLDSDTGIDVNDASDFPVPTSPQYIKAKITQFATGQYEIVHITAISTNTLTVTRAQEGTTALAFANGDDIELVDTAEMLSLLQSSFRPVKAITGATHTLSLADVGRYLLCNNAAGCDVTVAAQSTGEWAADTEIHGAADQESVTFTEDTGVTIKVPTGFDLAVTIGSAWTLKREAENVWRLIGNLVESA